ncbi:MAG: cytochrome bc1 complex diheme cytochrome c subunit [Nocardioidaceae bacterium]
MKFLSARRRHPLAGVVVLVLGLLVIGGLYSTLRPAAADDSKSDQKLISQGRHLFVVSCSSCHGMNAEGIKTKRGDNYGPPLIGVGAAAVDFQVGTGRMPLAVPGTQAQEREPVFTEKETAALAAYIASLGPGPAIPSKEQYNPSSLSEEQIAEGGSLFRTNCTACHNFAAQGGALPHGRYAPPLGGVEAKHMYEAMLTGPQQMPVFSDDVLTPQDKRQMIAYIKQVTTQPGYGGAKIGSLGPISEGLWLWTGGIGVLVLIAAWIGNNGVRARKRQ